jgi:hypothetical protein
MPRAVLVAAVLAGAICGPAAAHAPTTAIGRAVEALRQVNVSYDPAASVTEVEAGSFDLIAGDRVFVALLPAAALNEINGGPKSVAAEIAREARLRGTLVVLVGSRLTATSDDIDQARLAQLVSASKAASRSPAAQAQALVRAVRAEPGSDDGGLPWGWIAGVATLLLLVAGAVLARSRARSVPRDGRAPRRP